MDPEQRYDALFAMVRQQVREWSLPRRAIPIVPSMAPCPEHRGIGAWLFTRKARRACWDPHFVYVTSYGDPCWAYIICRNESGGACGAYRVGHHEWGRMVELVVDIIEHCWVSCPPYGTARTTYWYEQWERWLSIDDRVPIPALPSLDRTCWRPAGWKPPHGGG